MDALDKERLKSKQANQQKVIRLAQIYEEMLEPKTVILFRKLEEIIAFSQMPLTHINLVLDMLKKSCVDMSFEAYVTKGIEKVKKLEKPNG